MVGYTEKIYRMDIPATTANFGPGFDCFGIAFNLFNSFYFRTSGHPGELSFHSNLSLNNHPKSNLVYMAFQQSIRQFSNLKTPPGLEVWALNRIPTSRGLGSSATAVIAGILMAAALTDKNLKLSELLAMATEIEGHPDNVAAAIFGGFTLAIQDESTVLAQKVPWPEGLSVLVGVPELQVRTQAARNCLPKRVNLEDAVYNLQRSALVVNSLYQRDWASLSFALNDRLHQGARMKLIPGSKALFGALRGSEAIGTVLSGSGPCVLVLFEGSGAERVTRLADLMKGTWEAEGVSSRVLELAVHNEPVRLKRSSEEELYEFQDILSREEELRRVN